MNLERDFGSPEEAAVGSNAAKVTAVGKTISPDGTRAVVLVRAQSGRLLERFCVSRCGRWSIWQWDPASSAGLGNWTYGSPSVDGGILTAAGEVDPDVRVVAIRWGTDERQVEVSGGYFITAWWDVPYPGRDSVPEVVSLLKESSEDEGRG
jgi:hypothetical protein